MEAYGVPIEALPDIAAKVGVRLNLNRNGHSFTIRTLGPDPKYGRRSEHPYRQPNKDGKRPRIPGAVCWHGHRDFMIELFNRYPDARLKSALADYRGRDDFWNKFPETIEQPYERLGYQARAPLGCDCPDEDDYSMIAER